MFLAGGSRAEMENVREFRYPSSFKAPRASADRTSPAIVIPTTPTDFGMINAGWTIHLHAERLGSLIVLDGSAEFVKVDLVNGGYGALAGPIYDRKGNVLTPNKVQQPISFSTTSRFHLTAVPGEPYQVSFYKGSAVEKHTIKLSLL